MAHDDLRTILLRPIRPEDAELLTDGLARLSADSIHRRFLGPRSRLSGAELRYLTEVDGVDHVALVAVDARRPGRLAGVARFVRDRDDPAAAEAAIVVADELQGLGLGTRLGLRLADEARARGIERFTATLLGDNRAARRIFERISERLTAQPAGRGLAELVAELGPARRAA